MVAHWLAAGVGGKAIRAALVREHGYTGSYSAVARMLVALRGEQPPEVTVRLSFEPRDAVQVDFGAGPTLVDPDGQPRRTWAFAMTLCHSRHQYVEFVWDQTVATWLGCHRRAFEWFAAVPVRVIIYNAKGAITRACARDPLAQRAYAEGYNFRTDPCPPWRPTWACGSASRCTAIATVKFEHILYSAPCTLAGKLLWLRATDAAVALLEDFHHVATPPPRGRRPGECIIVRDHLPPHDQTYFAHDRGRCIEQAARVVPACAELFEQLLSDRIVERLRGAQGLIQF